MDNKITLWIAVVVVLALAVGGFFWWQSTNTNTAPTPTVNNEQQTQNNEENPIVNIDVTPVGTAHEITYTDAGYSPATLSIKVGDTVTWKNNSTGGLWTGSAMHPTHTGYNGTTVAQHCPDTDSNDFDQCKSEGPGTSWSFTFTKAGSWGYHNHMNSSKFGKIVVE